MPLLSPAGPTESTFAERLSGRAWRLIQTEPAPGAWNMSVDAALLEAAGRGADPVLRLYTWNPPAVSLGRFQRSHEGIHWPAVRRRGWDGVRRPTGGRAVLHQHELTYAIVLPPDVVGGTGVRRSYDVLGEGLRDALRRIVGSAAGAALPGNVSPAREAPANCFARSFGGDCVAAGGKVLGSAQIRSGGALLQHGSLLLDADRAAWREIFGGDGQLRTLREVSGRAVPMREAAEAFIRAFAATWGARLSPDQLRPIEAQTADAGAAKWSAGILP